MKKSAFDIIRSSHFNAVKKEQLIWLYEQLRHPQPDRDLVDDTKMKFGITTYEIFERIKWLENKGLI